MLILCDTWSINIFRDTSSNMALEEHLDPVLAQYPIAIF